MAMSCCCVVKVGTVRHRGESNVTSKSYGKEVRCSITRIQSVTRDLAMQGEQHSISHGKF